MTSACCPLSLQFNPFYVTKWGHSAQQNSVHSHTSQTPGREVSLTRGQDFPSKPCDINRVESSTHTLDLISAVTLKLHLADGLTVFSSCRFALRTEPSRASLWHFAFGRGGFHHWWVRRRKTQSLLRVQKVDVSHF